MAKTSISIGTKLFALLVSSVLLTGCYKIEIKETLNLDGTAAIATKIDMSGMADAMSNMGESLSVDIEGAGTLTEVPSEEVIAETYASCNDAALLEKYGAKTLEGPETVLTTLNVEKRTSCAAGENEGVINITVEETDTVSGETVSKQVLERKAENCAAPAILAFYQVSSFEEPISETYELDKTVEISCSDSRKEITINTVTSFSNNDESNAITEYFEKPAPVVIEEETLAELEALTLNETEIAAKEEETVEAVEVCSEIDQNPEELPFFFTGCENSAPGVGVFNFKKFDTTGLKINSNGTVTYRINSTTQEFNDEADNNASGNNIDSLSAAMIGIEMNYIFISPWPILEHSAGELTDEYTLTLNMLKLNQAEEVTVTLDTDGSTLDLVTTRTQLQIDQLVENLSEKLTSSSAPVERQVEYIYHLSSKIQRLAALKPSQQVPLGYLQTKLINLAEDLQIDPLAALEADFLSEIESLDTEVFADDEDGEEMLEAETEADEDNQEEVTAPAEVESDESEEETAEALATPQDNEDTDEEDALESDEEEVEEGNEDLEEGEDNGIILE